MDITIANTSVPGQWTSPLPTHIMHLSYVCLCACMKQSRHMRSVYTYITGVTNSVASLHMNQVLFTEILQETCLVFNSLTGHTLMGQPDRSHAGGTT